MVTDFEQLLGGMVNVSERELSGIVQTMGESEILTAFQDDPETMGFMLPYTIKKIKQAAALRKALKKMPKDQRKKARAGLMKKMYKRGVIAALPISPLGKLAALLALKRKEKRKKQKAAAKIKAATRSTTPDTVSPPVMTPETKQQDAYFPALSPYSNVATQNATQNKIQDVDQDEADGGEPKKQFDIKKMLPIIGIAAAALILPKMMRK